MVYRDAHVVVLAKCESLKKENYQLRRELLEMKDKINRVEVDRDRLGNMVGELILRTRERSGTHPLWVVSALVSFAVMCLWFAAYIANVTGCAS